MRGPHEIPFQFQLMGTTWRVRWGDCPKDKGPKKLGEHVGYCWDKTKTIYLHVELRRKKARDYAWRTFAHEVQHAFDKEMKGKKSYDEDGKRIKWRSMTHSRIYMNEVPLASLLENWRLQE